MAITSLSGSAITPTKPRTATLIQSATGSTWYTLLSTTTGRGVLTRISLVLQSLQGSNYQEIRITIDGTSTILTTLDSWSRAWSHQVSYTSNQGLSRYGFDYLTQLYFKQSIQVEVRHTALSSYTIDAVCDYSIE